jgi:hypothetical protein
MKKSLSAQRVMDLGNLPSSIEAGRSESTFKPLEKSTVTLFKPYLASKELGREQEKEFLEGVFFDEKGITAADTRILLHVKTETERRGIFRPNGKPVQGEIPKYHLPIGFAEIGNTLHYKTDVTALSNYLSAIEPFIDGDYPVLTTIAFKRQLFYCNFFLIATAVNTLLSQGITKADFYFRPDEFVDSNALLIKARFPMGEATILLMPMKPSGKLREMAAKGIAHENTTTSETVTDFFNFEVNDAVSFPKALNIQKERRLKRMAMKAKALKLRLKLLTI